MTLLLVAAITGCTIFSCAFLAFKVKMRELEKEDRSTEYNRELSKQAVEAANKATDAATAAHAMATEAMQRIGRLELKFSVDATRNAFGG